MLNKSQRWSSSNIFQHQCPSSALHIASKISHNLPPLKYTNQLITLVESTMFERICQLSYSLTIFIHLPRSLKNTSTYLNFNFKYKDRAKMSHKKMHTIRSLKASNIL